MFKILCTHNYNALQMRCRNYIIPKKYKIHEMQHFLKEIPTVTQNSKSYYFVWMRTKLCYINVYTKTNNTTQLPQSNIYTTYQPLRKHTPRPSTVLWHHTYNAIQYIFVLFLYFCMGIFVILNSIYLYFNIFFYSSNVSITQFSDWKYKYELKNNIFILFYLVTITNLCSIKCWLWNLISIKYVN